MGDLSNEQVKKFRALGSAARRMSKEYKKGDGPDPTSGQTYSGGAPQCTWGQLLDQAGFKPGNNYSTSNNTSALLQFVGISNTNINSYKIGEYDIKKLVTLGGQVMHANDPCVTAADRKAATWKLLDEIADEIERVFGKEDEEIFYYATAAEQTLQNLIMGVE